MSTPKFQPGDTVRSKISASWTGPMRVDYVSRFSVSCRHPKNGLGGFSHSELQLLVPAGGFRVGDRVILREDANYTGDDFKPGHVLTVVPPKHELAIAKTFWAYTKDGKGPWWSRNENFRLATEDEIYAIPFAPGDRIKRIRHPIKGQRDIGDIVTVLERPKNSKAAPGSVFYKDRNGEVTWSPAADHELYAKAGEFMVGDKVVVTHDLRKGPDAGTVTTVLRVSPGHIQPAKPDGTEYTDCAGWMANCFRLATPEEIAAAEKPESTDNLGPFKAGDIVECIRTFPRRLTKGKRYTVCEGSISTIYPHGTSVQIVACDEGQTTNWPLSGQYFRLAIPAGGFKAGDVVECVEDATHDVTVTFTEQTKEPVKPQKGDRVRLTVEGEVTRTTLDGGVVVKLDGGDIGTHFMAGELAAEGTEIEVLPRQFAVGDRVDLFGDKGEIAFILGDEACLKIEDGGYLEVAELEDLKHAPAESEVRKAA